MCGKKTSYAGNHGRAGILNTYYALVSGLDILKVKNWALLYDNGEDVVVVERGKGRAIDKTELVSAMQYFILCGSPWGKVTVSLL